MWNGELSEETKSWLKDMFNANDTEIKYINKFLNYDYQFGFIIGYMKK